MYNSLTIAHYFVKRSLDTQVPITPYKAEFMVYFAHGWHLAIEGIPLISERVCALRHGPSIKSVNKFYSKVKDIYTTLDSDVVGEIKELDYEFLDGVWAFYGHLNEVEMLSLCLELGTPWNTTYEASSADLYIDNHMIKQHYRLLHMSNPEICDLDDPISLVRA